MTSRAQILAAARKIIDRDGWEKLTIRGLAAELGIGATTLYHHVRDKDELLIHLLSEYLIQVERPELPSDPRDRIVVAATAGHDALAAWPWAAEVIMVDGFLGLLDRSAFWMVEAMLAGAIEYGCTQEQAVHVFRSIWYYTVGEVLVRAKSARRWADRPRPSYGDPDFARFDEVQQPHLAAIGEKWPEYAARDTYPQALRAFVDGLLAQVTEQPAGE